LETGNQRCRPMKLEAKVVEGARGAYEE
jgi:hypothetical protein